MSGHYRLVRMLARILFQMFHIRPRVSGIEHLDSVEEPFILVSNHSSNIDPVLLWGFFPAPLLFLAKVELAEAPVIGWISRTVGNVHVQRDGTDVGPMRRCLRLLRKSASDEDVANLAVFVEGTRSETGKIEGGVKAGAALLASRTGRPVVPVYLDGTEVVAPPGTLVPTFHPITIRIGAPLSLEFSSPKATPDELDAARDRMREAINALDPARSVPAS